MSIADLVSLLGLAQGLLLGAIIIWAHKPRRPTRLLGFFILTLALRILPFLLYRQPVGEMYPEIRWLPLYFVYLSLPLLYLYARVITGEVAWQRDWKHLIPGAVEFLFVSGLFLTEAVQPGSLTETQLGETIFTAYLVVSLGPGILYAYLIIALLNKSEIGITQYYSDLVGKDLRWLKIAVIFLVFIALSYFFLLFSGVSVTTDTTTIIGSVLNTLAIYYITVYGLRQFALHKTNHLPATLETTGKIPTTETSENPPTLFETVDEHVRVNKSFLNPQLTIADLSGSLHLSDRHLSRVINEGSGMHFNGYINRYRVDYAKDLLRDEGYDHYNMGGIATEAGFNNKATFYKAFKRYAERSPAAFRKQRNVSSGAD